MTYVLGWKSDSKVFLAADSALTTISDSPRLDLPRSSFGQNHVVASERKVEERALKLFLKENIGVAIAGRYDLAVRITKSFYKKIEEGLLPNVALKEAIFLNSPFPKGATVQIAVAFFDGNPRLLSFNSNGDFKIRDDEQIVHLGSAPSGYKTVNEGWLKEDILPATKNLPEFQLPSMLGILQSHGILNPTLQVGIGGAFSGLYVDTNGGHWQPDMLFIEECDNLLVSPCIRNDCFVVNSPVLGESRCFLTYLPPRSESSLREQTTRAIESARELKNSAKYDYVFIMNKKLKTLTLLQMSKNLRHDFLWLEPFSESDGSMGTKVFIFSKLRNIINRNEGGVAIIPYREPSTNELPKKVIKKDVRSA